MGNVLTKDRKYDTRIWKCNGIVTDAFQKLNKTLKNRRIALETKIRC